jgi:ribokinase
VRAAVVGHVEWLSFGTVDHVPRPGEIAHASNVWDAPAGGGSVAAVQLAKLAGGCEFFTAVGDDDLGRAAVLGLTGLGVTVHAAVRDAPTRRAVSLTDADQERTITTLGDRLEPRGDDPLPWDLLDATDAVYVTAGDPGAFRAARQARVMVVTSRVLAGLELSGVVTDALVGSANDRDERVEPDALRFRPALIVRTDGERGGTYETADGGGAWDPAPARPGGDAYGGGDSFAGGLTFGLGANMTAPQAMALAARCGAACVSGRGPYASQLTAAELGPGPHA